MNTQSQFLMAWKRLKCEKRKDVDDSELYSDNEVA